MFSPQRLRNFLFSMFDTNFFFNIFLDRWVSIFQYYYMLSSKSLLQEISKWYFSLKRNYYQKKNCLCILGIKFLKVLVNIDFIKIDIASVTNNNYKFQAFLVDCFFLTTFVFINCKNTVIKLSLSKLNNRRIEHI